MLPIRTGISSSRLWNGKHVSLCPYSVQGWNLLDENWPRTAVSYLPQGPREAIMSGEEDRTRQTRPRVWGSRGAGGGVGEAAFGATWAVFETKDQRVVSVRLVVMPQALSCLLALPGLWNNVGEEPIRLTFWKYYASSKNAFSKNNVTSQW